MKVTPIATLVSLTSALLSPSCCWGYDGHDEVDINEDKHDEQRGISNESFFDALTRRLLGRKMQEEPQEAMPFFPPNKMIAGYYSLADYEQNNLRLKDISPDYNTVFIYNAVAEEESATSLKWSVAPYEGFKEDCEYLRSQGVRLILSVGGDDEGIPFSIWPSGGQINDFVDSVKSLIDDDMGGADGLDWHQWKSGSTLNTFCMGSISVLLKNHYEGVNGSPFMITASPAPWDFAAVGFRVLQLLSAGMRRVVPLDFVHLQFFGESPAENDLATILGYLGEWVPSVGEDRIILGLGVRPGGDAEYMDAAKAQSVVQSVLETYPGIKGATQWELGYDHSNGNDGFNDVVAVLAPLNQ